MVRFAWLELENEITPLNFGRKKILHRLLICGWNQIICGDMKKWNKDSKVSLCSASDLWKEKILLYGTVRSLDRNCLMIGEKKIYAFLLFTEQNSLKKKKPMYFEIHNIDKISLCYVCTPNRTVDKAWEELFEAGSSRDSVPLTKNDILFESYSSSSVCKR